MCKIFKSKIRYDEIIYYLKYFKEIKIENDEIFLLVEELTNLAYPTYEDQYDKRWSYFYIPVGKCKTIAIPIGIAKYKEEFFVYVQSFGNFHIKKGNIKTEKFYKNIFTEILRFMPIVKKHESILRKIVPYEVRTGRIKGYYILDNLLSQSEKKTILDNYKRHIENNFQIKEISLNDYMNIAAICYNAAYKDEAKNLSPIELYKRWADGRDGGMLSIKDWNSKKEFSEWYDNGQLGGHPFEIVFSWHEHGIHLYPPDNTSPFYIIRVTNYAYAIKFIEMVKKLIEMNIPFKANNLENVLDFLVGDTYFTVNKFGNHDLRYITSKEYRHKYFPYIEWDEIKIVKWKNESKMDK